MTRDASRESFAVDDVAELAIEREKVELLFEQMKEGVILFDANGLVRFGRRYDIDSRYRRNTGKEIEVGGMQTARFADPCCHM